MKSVTKNLIPDMVSKTRYLVLFLYLFSLANCLVIEIGSVEARAIKIIPLKDPRTENLVLSLYRQASTELKAGQRVKARKLLIEAAKYDQTGMTPYVHALLSQVYYELSNPESAVTEALISLKYNPKQKKLIHNLALYAKEANQYERAISYLELSKKKARSARKEEIDSLIVLLRKQQESANRFPLNSEDYLDKLTYEDSVNKWPKSKLPLKVYIQPSSNAKGFKPNFPSLAKESFIDWYKASSRKLSFEFVGAPEKADIKLQWTDKRLRITDDKKERLKAGLTTSQITVSGVIKDSLIQIRTRNPFNKKGISNDKIKSTCLHEIGHALGLSGHSSNHADIMFMGVAKRQFPALTKRDKKTIQKLYNSYNELAMHGVPKSPPPSKQVKNESKIANQNASGSQQNSPTNTNNLGINQNANPNSRGNVVQVPAMQYQQQAPYAYAQPNYRQPYPPQYPQVQYANPPMVPAWQANIPVQAAVPYYRPPQTPYVPQPMPPQYQYAPPPQMVPMQVYQAPQNMYTYAPPAIQLNQATPYPVQNNYQNQRPNQQNQFQQIDAIFQNFKPKIQQFLNSGMQNQGQSSYPNQ